MLEQLNNYIKTIIMEEASSDIDANAIRNAYNYNEFFNRYIYDLALSLSIRASKQSENTFLIFGSLKSIKTFLKKFKVDKNFIDKPSKFEILSPSYILYSPEETALKTHNMMLGEAFPSEMIVTGVPTLTTEYDNISRTISYNRHYDFMESDANISIKNKTNRKIKKIVPAELAKVLDHIKKNNNLSDDDLFALEFMVNCRHWANSIFDDESEYSYIEDDVN